MKREAGLLIAVAAGLVVAGWHFRAPLRAWVGAVPGGAAVVPAATAPDVLYTWVDADGVTHFSQTPGQGTRLQYDGSRITPLASPPPAAVAKVRAEAEAGAGQGSQSLRELREELARNAQRMQEAKAANADY